MRIIFSCKNNTKFFKYPIFLFTKNEMYANMIVESYEKVSFLSLKGFVNKE